MKSKYLVCRPMGGLNDMMNRIVLCVEYCKRYGRILIIDSVSAEFGSDLFEYFSPIIGRVYSSISYSESSFRGSTVRPSFIDQEIFSYKSIHKTGTNNFDHLKTGLTFDFDYFTEYSEDVLINHMCGGGVHSHRFFDYFSPSVDLLRALKIRVDLLGKNYIALHVRNTDIKTDYIEISEQIFQLYGSGRKYFLATDSLEARNRIFEIAYRCRVNILTWSDLLSVHGAPIHRAVSMNRDQIYQRNTESILDLMTLVLAEEYYYSVGPLGAKSGYSGLAEGLANGEFKLNLKRCLIG